MSNRKKILVTGASGFVGSAMCADLASKGHQVVAAVRDTASGRRVVADALIDVIEVGNIDGETDWTAALVGCSSVVHLAARAHVLRDLASDPMALFRETNVAAAVRLAKAAIEAGVRRFVFVSSIGVNGNRSDHPFSERDAPAPVEHYAVSKLEAELALRELADGSGMELVIVRPPLVYGPGCPGNFLRLLKLVSIGMPLPFGAIKNSRSFVSVWNLTDFLIACVTHRHAGGRTFLVSDMQDVSLPDLLRQLARGMGKRAGLLSISPALMAALARLSGRSDVYEKLCGSLTVDPRQIREVLGWTPPVTLAEGLGRTARWYASDKERASA